MNKSIIAHTALEMEEIGIDLSSILRDGMVVSLVGPLGSGKTTLSKGIAKGLLITDVVVSPSYMIARSYEGRIPMHHIDAYRLSSLDELAEVGLDEYLPPDSGVSIVEWPERIEGLVEISDIHVTIEPLTGDDRRVNISKP
jgi:tRNA threonylcarbamoyladenosine biosynthesis protein TsaE